MCHCNISDKSINAAGGCKTCCGIPAVGTVAGIAAGSVASGTKGTLIGGPVGCVVFTGFYCCWFAFKGGCDNKKEIPDKKVGVAPVYQSMS